MEDQKTPSQGSPSSSISSAKSDSALLAACNSPLLYADTALREILSDPQDTETATLLFAFLNELPDNGKEIIANEINRSSRFLNKDLEKLHHENPVGARQTARKQLRELDERLFSALLLQCKSCTSCKSCNSCF